MAINLLVDGTKNERDGMPDLDERLVRSIRCMVWNKENTLSIHFLTRYLVYQIQLESRSIDQLAYELRH